MGISILMRKNPLKKNGIFTIVYIQTRGKFGKAGLMGNKSTVGPQLIIPSGYLT